RPANRCRTMPDLPDQGSTTSRGAAGPARRGDRPEEGERPEEHRGTTARHLEAAVPAVGAHGVAPVRLLEAARHPGHRYSRFLSHFAPTEGPTHITPPRRTPTSPPTPHLAALTYWY